MFVGLPRSSQPARQRCLGRTRGGQGRVPHGGVVDKGVSLSAAGCVRVVPHGGVVDKGVSPTASWWTRSGTAASRLTESGWGDLNDVRQGEGSARRWLQVPCRKRGPTEFARVSLGGDPGALVRVLFFLRTNRGRNWVTTRRAHRRLGLVCGCNRALCTFFCAKKPGVSRLRRRTAAPRFNVTPLAVM